MRYWVYKCNSKSMPHQVVHGDWNRVFATRKAIRWGTTERIRGLSELAVGDLVLAYQSDRNELVGLAEVVDLKRKSEHLIVVLKAVREIRAKVRPLKRQDAKIAAIPALQPGPIKTIYSISTDDAEALLAAASTTETTA